VDGIERRVKSGFGEMMGADYWCDIGTPLSQSVGNVDPSACAAGTIFGCCGVMLEVISILLPQRLAAIARDQSLTAH
jgi:hypothetical protein